LIGKTPSADVLTNAAKIALEGAEPLAKNKYKVPLTQTLVHRALAKVGGVSARRGSLSAVLRMSA